MYTKQTAITYCFIQHSISTSPYRCTRNRLPSPTVLYNTPSVPAPTGVHGTDCHHLLFYTTLHQYQPLQVYTKQTAITYCFIQHSISTGPYRCTWNRLPSPTVLYNTPSVPAPTGVHGTDCHHLLFYTTLHQYQPLQVYTEQTAITYCFIQHSISTGPYRCTWNRLPSPTVLYNTPSVPAPTGVHGTDCHHLLFYTTLHQYQPLQVYMEQTAITYCFIQHSINTSPYRCTRNRLPSPTVLYNTPSVPAPTGVHGTDCHHLLFYTTLHQYQPLQVYTEQTAITYCFIQHSISTSPYRCTRNRLPSPTVLYNTPSVPAPTGVHGTDCHHLLFYITLHQYQPLQVYTEQTAITYCFIQHSISTSPYRCTWNRLPSPTVLYNTPSVPAPTGVHGTDCHHLLFYTTLHQYQPLQVYTEQTAITYCFIQHSISTGPYRCTWNRLPSPTVLYNTPSVPAPTGVHGTDCHHLLFYTTLHQYRPLQVYMEQTAITYCFIQHSISTSPYRCTRNRLPSPTVLYNTPSVPAPTGVHETDCHHLLFYTTLHQYRPLQVYMEQTAITYCFIQHSISTGPYRCTWNRLPSPTVLYNIPSVPAPTGVHGTDCHHLLFYTKLHQYQPLQVYMEQTAITYCFIQHSISTGPYRCTWNRLPSPTVLYNTPSVPAPTGVHGTDCHHLLFYTTFHQYRPLQVYTEQTAITYCFIQHSISTGPYRCTRNRLPSPTVLYNTPSVPAFLSITLTAIVKKEPIF